MLDLPCGTAVYLCRALAKDSWLQWHDALPEEEDQWSRLTGEVVAEIKALASGLHQLHKAMPEYKQCDSSPFTVSRWWDPDDDEGWELGRFCLFRFEGKSALEECDEADDMFVGVDPFEIFERFFKDKEFFADSPGGHDHHPL